MNYREWNLLTKQEVNGITIDYTDPEDNLTAYLFVFTL